ncbi:MAG: Gfo/Idh/MocA family oxidoreductase [Chloroflexota bacterium]|nr:Gfo/Idh/MocA family oxidoreductase [Chloroflexota bacterium]
MRAIRVGLIGCGRIAQLKHLPILAALPNAQLVALAEHDAARRAQAREQVPQAHAFASYQELLYHSDVEAVVICLPSSLHAEAAIAALEAHKHVYLEKPIATDLADAAAVVAAWREAQTIGMIGFNFRFDARYQKMRQQVCTGAVGELLAVRSLYSTAARTLPIWKERRSSGGGVLLDLASHHIDLVRYVLDTEIELVWADIISRRSEEDNATLYLQLRSGLLVQSFFSMGSVDAHQFEVYGQEGRLMVDRLHAPDVELLRPSLKHLRLKRLGVFLRRLLYTPNYNQPFQAALHTFVEAVRTGESVAPNLLDGCRSLAVVAAAEESARTYEAVALSESGALSSLEAVQ